VYIFVNNNTNFNFLKILSNYTIWDRLSQKTISRYCPFKYGAFNIHYPESKMSRNKLRDISLKVLLRQMLVFENSAKLSLLRP
jgi:hypothetical protein